jgi:hypothetical protein
MDQYIRDTEKILDGISYLIWDENKKDSSAAFVTPLRIGFFTALAVIAIVVFFRRRAQRLQK